MKAIACSIAVLLGTTIGTVAAAKVHRGHAQWVSKKSREIDFTLVGDLRAARADALKQARAYCEGKLKARKVLDVRNRTVHYNCLSGD